MAAYLIRKLINTIPTVFGVALITFALLHVVGGDPTYMIMGKHGNERVRMELRQQLGLDKPLPAQFVDYLGQIVTFDFGDSLSTRRPVIDMVMEGVGPSLALAIPAFFATTILAIIVGLCVAYFRGRAVDRSVMILCIIGMSLPSLAYILYGQYYLAFVLGWFPVHGFEASFPECLEYVWLPMLIWVMVSLGYDVRFYRTAILEESNQDYVRTARAKGLTDRKVFLKHVLKNSMVPIITSVIVQVPALLLGSLLLETFFGIPGLGYITVSAVNNSDFPVIKAMAVIQSLILIVGLLLTDIAYTLVDPRVRLK
jgi:peptide/nickel transport system permease protein